MELDRTLLVWDYLNGEPLEILDGGVPDPVGPSAAAAAFDRAAFRDAGGFDEALFAYWEDVDLVLRLRREGCALRARRGRPRHARALGELRLGLGAQELPDRLRARLRAAQVGGAHAAAAARRSLARDAVVCAGQALIDRNLSGVRGRIEGYRAARPSRARIPRPAGRPGAGGRSTRCGGAWRRRRGCGPARRATASPRQAALDRVLPPRRDERAVALARARARVAGRARRARRRRPRPTATSRGLFGEFAAVTVADYAGADAPAATPCSASPAMCADVRRFAR